jgi:hypothetical protein
MQDEDLYRLQLLEDQEALRRLMALYVRYWDAGFQDRELPPEESARLLADLFTRDGVWDGGEVSRTCRGREEICEFATNVLRSHLEDSSGAVLSHRGLAVHYATTPLIDVDGDTAIGYWNGLIASSFAPIGKSLWVGVKYENRCVRTTSGWRFQEVKVFPAFSTPYEGEGWVRQPFMLRSGAAS